MGRAPAVTLSLALSLAACARTPARGAGGEPRFDAREARADVAWLADPARTGRGTGTEGNLEAARWLEDRLRRLGLAPAFPEGFAQPFEAPFRATLRDGNALAVNGAAARLHEGFQPFGFSDDGAVEAELVFAGWGITAPDLGYDDYAGLDVKGKVVLVLQDFPRERDEASPFRAPSAYRYAEWRYKATNARDHGAVALVGVRDAWAHAGVDALPPWRGQVSSRVGLVAVRATAAALAAGGVDVAALAAPGEADGKPHSRPLARKAALAAAIEHERARTANVAALLPGSDPAVAGECVVVGAHYDHLGLGGDASLAPDRIGTVHPGADDNASGVAALLLVARALREAGPQRRTILFAAFGAEELGLLGSAALVRSPPPACAVDRMQLMVNLDMVGRPQRGRLYVEGVDTAQGLRERVAALAARPPAAPFQLSLVGDGYGPSDQTTFYARGVPVLFLFTGAHADYHRPTDTADKVDPAAVAEVARLAYRAAHDAADAPARLVVVRTAAPAERTGARERGYGAYLGTIPDFGERTEPGVLVSGVRPGSPAEKAGLAAGDVLLRVGGAEVRNLQDLVYQLRAHRPGDEVELDYARGAERRTVKVRLEERR